MMYLSRIFASINKFSRVNSQIRCFSSTQKENKVKLYLEKAKLIDLLRLALRSNSNNSLTRLLNSRDLDSFIVTNVLKSAPSPDSALSLIEILKENPHFSHTQNTLHALAKILAKSGQTGKLKALITGINSGKFGKIAHISYMDRIRLYALSNELDEVVKIWNEWRVLQKNRKTCTESYNIIMDLYAKNGDDLMSVKIFRSLINEGALPNARTYTVIIKHLVNTRKFDSAMEIFRLLPLIRIKRTLKQYSVLVVAFTGINQLNIVKTLLDEMQLDGILPGPTLIQQISPDQRIKNIVYSSSDDEIENENDEEDKEEEEVDQVKLKPWLDPSALARALDNWGPDEVLELEKAGFIWTTRLVCKMIRAFKKAQTAWEFFCWVSYQPNYTHDIYSISRMIAKAARFGFTDIIDQLLLKTQREGIKLSFTTVKLIVDFYGLSGKGEAALKVFNNIETICGPIPKSSLFILYSSLLRTLSKCKMTKESLNILEDMILLGISPDIQMYTGLMHHFAIQGDIKTVQRLFSMVKQSGIEPDGYMYKVLIRAYCKCDRAALAQRVFEEMCDSDLSIDLNTKDLLVKSLWKEGKLREAAKVEEMSEEIKVNVTTGQLYTVSSTDLKRVYDIYSSSFVKTFD